MFLKSLIKKITPAALFLTLLSTGSLVYAFHSWGGYHWARTSNPFIVKLGDNVSSSWDYYLEQASNDWNQSSVLKTAVVRGSNNPKLCRGTSGMVEVCSGKYGFNGWLGIASVWVKGDHITKGTVKLNDSYFNTKTYNRPSWKTLVMCQEVGHMFGLGHQDEDFYNDNLGSCMDYTINPAGPPLNEHPGYHDYEEIELIYSHNDSTTTLTQILNKSSRRFGSRTISEGGDYDLEDWISSKKEEVNIQKEEMKNRLSVLENNLSQTEKVIDFIFWIPE